MSDSITTEKIDSLNTLLFRSETYSERRETLKNELSSLRLEIRKKLKELNDLPADDNAEKLTHEQFQAFYDLHPCASINCKDDIILGTSNQSVAFHCARGTISGNNDDTVYVTRPMYGFDVNFLMSGNIRIRTSPTNTMTSMAITNEADSIIDTIEKYPYGHPHATLSSGSDNYGSPYAAICQGNNRFLDEYKNFLIHPAPSDFMALLNKVMVWLTTANLNDMYDTPLYYGVKLNKWLYTQDAREFSEWLFTWMQVAHEDDNFRVEPLVHAMEQLYPADTAQDDTEQNATEHNDSEQPVKKRIVTDISDFLQFSTIPRAYKEVVLFQYAYALFLATHPSLLNHARRSLKNAVCTDVAMFHHCCHSVSALNSSQWHRVSNAIFRAPAEMKLYLGTTAVNHDPALQFIRA